MMGAAPWCSSRRQRCWRTGLPWHTSRLLTPKRVRTCTGVCWRDRSLSCCYGTNLYMMLCKMEAKGVMPMPAPMSTACSEVKILRVGVP